MTTYVADSTPGVGVKGVLEGAFTVPKAFPVDCIDALSAWLPKATAVLISSTSTASARTPPRSPSSFFADLPNLVKTDLTRETNPAAATPKSSPAPKKGLSSEGSEPSSELLSSLSNDGSSCSCKASLKSASVSPVTMFSFSSSADLNIHS